MSKGTNKINLEKLIPDIGRKCKQSVETLRVVKE